MDRDAKTAKARNGVNAPGSPRSRRSADPDKRPAEQRLADALAQQAAVAEILDAMAASPTDAQPVMDAVAKRAALLCHAQFARVTLVEGEVLRPLAHYSVDGESPIPMQPVTLQRTSITGRTLVDRKTVHHADIVPLLDTEYPDALFNATSSGIRAILSVPLICEGDANGAIFLWRREPGLFAPDQVALVETFARQAAIAIRNVRLSDLAETRARELAESLRQQTATNEVLKIISRSTFDLNAVLQTLIESAARLCDADKGTITRQRDGQFYRAESVGFSRAFMDYVKDVPIVPERATATGRALLEGRVVHIPDVRADPEYSFAEAQRLGDFRSILSVPMMREGTPIGVMVLTRSDVRPFSDKQIDLLSSFAEQAVIAIENVRLFTELDVRNRDLSIALEQQTATSELLKVIGRSTFDLQPVFAALAENAVRLCAAERGLIFRFDGQYLRYAVGHNVSTELVDFFDRNPIVLDRGSTSGRAAVERRTIHIHDVRSDSDYTYGGSGVDPYRTVLAIPMLKAAELLGVIVIYRYDVQPFTESQVALMETFADQAVIAIENVRLLNELEARTTQLTRSVGELRALGDVGQAVSSTLDLETVLSTIVSRATQLTGMDGGAIYEYDEARGEFYLNTADSLPQELVEALRNAPIRKGEGALGRLAVTGEPVQIVDIADERVYQSGVRETLIRHGYRSLLAVPLLREGHLLGGLVVNRKRVADFDAQVIDLLKTFASQSALAIQNARLFREIEAKGRQLETASQHKSEFLANMSHELRTPLNAIIGFSEVLSERLFGELNAKQAEYVIDITESGRHLLTLINDILDLSKIEAGRMELDAGDFDLPVTIDNAMSLVRERAQRRGIALRCAVAERLPTIRADERKVKQVLLNLLSNALKFTPEGGTVEVRASAYDDRVEIAVADTGVGIAPEDQEAVFEEFRQVGRAAKKIEGTGLGLAISRKFIELHGGTIRVESQVGHGSTFTFTLPQRLPR